MLSSGYMISITEFHTDHLPPVEIDAIGPLVIAYASDRYKVISAGARGTVLEARRAKAWLEQQHFDRLDQMLTALIR